jgi:hypothetical protein
MSLYNLVKLVSRGNISPALRSTSSIVPDTLASHEDPHSAGILRAPIVPDTLASHEDPHSAGILRAKEVLAAPNELLGGKDVVYINKYSK